MTSARKATLKAEDYDAERKNAKIYFKTAYELLHGGVESQFEGYYDKSEDIQAKNKEQAVTTFACAINSLLRIPPAFRKEKDLAKLHDYIMGQAQAYKAMGLEEVAQRVEAEARRDFFPHIKEVSSDSSEEKSAERTRKVFKRKLDEMLESSSPFHPDRAAKKARVEEKLGKAQPRIGKK